MGASSSREQQQVSSREQRDLEAQAASMCALPFLQKAFSALADPLSNSIPPPSLEQCFSLKYKSISCEGTKLPDGFAGLLDHLGSSVTDLFFAPQKGRIGWVEFLRGYIKCCSRISASSLLNIMFRVIASSAEKDGTPLKLQFDSDEADSKTNGSISPAELGMILWTCWLMSWSSRSSKCSEENEEVDLPNVNHLVLSAIITCAETGSDFDVSSPDALGLDAELTAGKIHMWALRTVPSLADSFPQFIHSRVQKAAACEKEMGSSSADDKLTVKMYEPHLLTRGRAWAISLSQRSNVSEEILRICFSWNVDMSEGALLYWSSRRGKGLNRFWSSIEGYHGPLLILISAYSSDGSETDTNSRKWIIGALTQHGFENRDVFYGAGGHLFAICPVFHVFSPSGKEKNFLYSHLHPVGRVYEPHPKPVGIGFGGTIGNFRVFIDEDFSKVTIRHHAGDKTYQPGSLIPTQGFLPVEASVADVEVWGFGGKTAKEVQTSYKKREELFTEQRRKVDLKTFSSWEDSPEKMMMDMTSDPNRVQREDR
ncbi:hypothetical protein Ancab_016713 [Ancistrocladus abbreviatus]